MLRDREEPAAAGVPTDQLPLYVQPATPGGSARDRTWREATVLRWYLGQCATALATSLVVLVVGLAGLVEDGRRVAADGAVVLVAVGVLSGGAFAAAVAIASPAERRRQPFAGLTAQALLTPPAGGVPLRARTGQVVGFILVVGYVAWLGLSWTGFAIALAGLAAVGTAYNGARLRRVTGEERGTGWWRLLSRHGRRRGPDTRTYAGDGLMAFGCLLSLPVPLADLHLGAVEPEVRWLVLEGTGRGEEALALAAGAHGPGAPIWGVRAALSAFKLGRAADAERWVQRAVDDGCREPVGDLAFRVLAPLRHTPALRALRRQAG